MKDQLSERTTDSMSALTRLQQDIESLGHQITYLEVGHTIKTWQCFLDTPQQQRFIGCGKGFGIQSKTSATFEAFEHQVDYHYHLIEPITAPVFFSLNELRAINGQDLYEDLPATLLRNADPNLKFPCLEFHSLQDDAVIYLPLYLMVPSYSHEKALEKDELGWRFGSELASSSGNASGLGMDEAILHGLNECIERDATSSFLVNVFLKNTPPKLVDKNTVPTYLQTAIQEIEADFQETLCLVEITSKFGVPTYCVSLTQQSVPIQPKGYGTSLNPAYALERALLEALQPLHLRTDSLNQVENNTLKRLEPYPLLAKAAAADLKPLLAAKNYTVIDFNEGKKTAQFDFDELSVAEQKNTVLEKLSAHNHPAYYRVIKEFNSGICCIKIYIPGLDNFHLIQTGKKIFPRNFTP